MFIGAVIGLAALPGYPAAILSFHNATVIDIPVGTTALVIALEVATTLSLPLAWRLSQVGGAIVTVSATTAMVRDMVALAPAALVAVSTNVMLVGVIGATKLGIRVLLAFRVTTGPAV